MFPLCSHLDFGGNRFSVSPASATPKVARHRDARYGSPIHGQSHGRAWKPVFKKAHRRPHCDCWRFFCVRIYMAAMCGQASAWPVTFLAGISTLHIAATQSRGKDRVGFVLKKELQSCIHAIHPESARLRIAAWPLVPCTLTHRLPAALPATTTIWTALVPLKRPLSIHARTPSLRPDRRIV